MSQRFQKFPEGASLELCRKSDRLVEMFKSAGNKNFNIISLVEGLKNTFLSSVLNIK